MIDRSQKGSHLLRWRRVEHDLPPGLHRPKLTGDVGWDLEAMSDVTIGPMQSADVPVNAQIWLPEGFYADVRNRSSMARRGLYVDQNVIDNGYRGPLFVFIRNMEMPLYEGGYGNGAHLRPARNNTRGEGAVTIKAGERIAQLVFHKAAPVWDVELKSEAFEDNTQRGAAGFGSTGK